MPIILASEYTQIGVIRTGTVIDKLSGIGGLPRGRITEVFGDAGLGKSTVCLQSVASAQKQGLRCLWADLEYAYDGRYAESLGVDNENLGLLQERFAEEALDALEKAVEDGGYDLVVLDSVGAIHSRTEAEKSSAERTIGTQAGLMARFCRKIAPLIAVNKTAFVVINHSYVDIMSGRIGTSGGKKLEYHKSLSIRLKTTNKSLKQGDRIIGKVVMAQVKKNKLAPTEGMEVESQILFGEGFSASADLLDEAITFGVIRKEGNTYFFSQEKLGTIGKAREWIKTNEEKVRNAIGTL